MSKVNDPRAQQIHRENADRMCLGSFVAGLSGVVGRQLRYAHPRTLQEVLNLALAVDEADRLQVAVLRLADPAKAFYITHVHSCTLKTRHGRSSRRRSRMI